MNISYHLSKELYPYLLPSIMSVLDHNPKAKIFIFCEDDALPYELPKGCKVINVTNQNYIKHSSPNWSNWFHWVCLTKVLDAKYLPKASKVLQLDVDTIVNDDLSELYNIDMKDNWFAMVNESTGTYKPYGDKYYNAGVVLVNLKQLRADNADDKLINFINTIKVPYIEQDAYNIIGKDKIIELPTRFNESKMTGETDAPAIVHYVSVRQHWLSNVPRAEFYQRYKKFERV